jgi:hypothetical protein
MQRWPLIAVGLYLAWLPLGAAAADHWAYVAPVRPAVPVVRGDLAARSTVDAFIRSRLVQDGLAPSPEADRPTLIRRACLALTGLPPTPAEVEAYLDDRSPDAYERVVDRLLASPRYGERMAADWLDLARYADTHGYHSDSQRTMWRWRDWVIEALNAGMPYDQFTIEQLAGDLLPGATLDQRVATGFHRNHMLNDENGAIPDEFLSEYLVDRVVTTGAVWLGQTFLCARCHDHKYDPLTQRDFYRLYAFFNSVPENGLGGRTGNSPPTLVAPTRQQQAELDAMAAELAGLERRMATRAAAAEESFAAWRMRQVSLTDSFRQLPADGVLHLPLNNETELTGGVLAKGNPSWAGGKLAAALLCDGQTYIEVPGIGKWERTEPFSISAWVFPTTGDPSPVAARLDEAQSRRGYELTIENERLVFRLTHAAATDEIAVASREPLKQRKWQHVVATYDGSGKAGGVALYLDGVRLNAEIRHGTLTGHVLGDQPLTIGRGDTQTFFRGLLDDVQLFSRQLSASEVAVLAGGDPILAILSTPVQKQTAEQQLALWQHYLENFDPEYRDAFAAANAVKSQRKKLLAAAPCTMVMEELPEPRKTYVLERGLYDQRGELVTAGTPAFLPPMSGELPRNRLGLARWLVDGRNPLTSRVAVDRAWQALFGAGLVRTPDDWGTRGQKPTHPELLDWLATDFVGNSPRSKVQGPRSVSHSTWDFGPWTLDRSWDVKRLHRMLATSATFRQSSRVSPELLARDPENRLWARGPRYRLTAEAVRDQALAAAGLLDVRVGGPSVRPYQPAELWRELAYNPDEYTAQVFVPSTGADLYRRSIYTFWKRSVPPPNLSLLDAPDRESCTVARSRTSTPLAALMLLNDTTFVEAARKLAERVLSEGGPTDEQRFERLFKIVLARQPTQKERMLLARHLAAELAEFRGNSESAKKLLSVGESTADPQFDPAELAAWTMVASTVLNLDETVSLR